VLRRVFVIALILGALAVMVPPFFTQGACTAEFDAAGGVLEGLRPHFGTLSEAQSYLTSQSIPFRLVSAQRCESWPPRDVVVCPGGPILLFDQPVRNRVCRYYRDGTIRLQLGFNSSLQLVRLQTDMDPYRMIRLPLSGYELDWAK